jgi:hypothetical protein
MDPTKLQERWQWRKEAQKRATTKGTMSMRAFFPSNVSTIGGGSLPASVAAPVDAGQQDTGNDNIAVGNSNIMSSGKDDMTRGSDIVIDTMVDASNTDLEVSAVQEVDEDSVREEEAASKINNDQQYLELGPI